MIKSFVLPIALSIPVIIFQLVIIPHVSFDGIVPNLLVILIVLFTLVNDQIFGTILGFLVGFLYDLTSGGMLGVGMFSLTITGFVSGYFCRQNELDQGFNLINTLMIIFFTSSIGSFITAALTIESSNNIFTYYLFELGILPGIYTALTALPFLIYLNIFRGRMN